MGGDRSPGEKGQGGGGGGGGGGQEKSVSPKVAGTGEN